MAGPYANYVIAILNTLLSTTSKEIYKFHAPNVSKGQPGILQVEIQTEGTSGLKAVFKMNGKDVFKYGPSSSNITRVLQSVISSDAFKVTDNSITGEIVAGSGTFRIKTIVIWWRAE